MSGLRGYFLNPLNFFGGLQGIAAAIGIAVCIFGAGYIKGRVDGAAKWKPIAQSYKQSAHKWQDRAHAWKASFDKSEDFRTKEHKASESALDAEKSSCGGKIAQQKESDRRFRLSLAKPIKLDGQGCYARDEITLAKDAGWRP